MRPIPLRDVAYAEIRKKILTGEYAPGHFLAEVALADEIGMSRTPIREALERLRKEKLVRRVAGRGVFVSEIHVEDVRELFEVREALECLAIRLAIERLPEESINEFQETFWDVQARQTKQERIPLETQIAVDRRFHEFIAHQSQNQLLIQFLGDIFNHNERIMAVTTRIPTRFRASTREHLAIIEALKNRDVASAEDAMRSHIRAGRDLALAISS
ncbi:MAG: GntR family transcriptional regulator [Firmicutes bacterium]|nr:GntR family transcriptional regulator [Bacillota bacterium]